LAIVTLTTALLADSSAGAASEPVALPGFEVCTLPCWAGIMIGDTTMTEAQALVVTHLPSATTQFQFTPNEMTVDIEGFSTPEMIMIRINSDEHNGQVVISEINLQLSYPFENLLTQFGAPDCLNVIDASSEYATIIWQRGSFSVVATTIVDSEHPWRHDTTTEILRVVMGGEFCEQLNYAPWSGFAKLWRYEQ